MLFFCPLVTKLNHVCGPVKEVTTGQPPSWIHYIPADCTVIVVGCQFICRRHRKPEKTKQRQCVQTAGFVWQTVRNSKIFHTNHKHTGFILSVPQKSLQSHREYWCQIYTLRHENVQRDTKISASPASTPTTWFPDLRLYWLGLNVAEDPQVVMVTADSLLNLLNEKTKLDEDHQTRHGQPDVTEDLREKLKKKI